MRQEITRRVHDLNGTFPIRHADVNVQPENEQRARDSLQFLDQQLIPLVVEDFLILPMRDRMRRRSDDDESILLRQPGDDAAESCDVSACFLDVATNARAHFHHRLDHLGLDLLAQQHLAFFEDLRDMRAQFARLWINDLKFLFDAQCELIEHLPSFPSPLTCPKISRSCASQASPCLSFHAAGVATRCPVSVRDYKDQSVRTRSAAHLPETGNAESPRLSASRKSRRSCHCGSRTGG